MTWCNGPFWPSKLWNQCGRILLSCKSRTNIRTKLHCCFFSHAGLLLASIRWPSLASLFKLYIVIILLCQVATWFLFAPEMRLQTFVHQIWFNHLQALSLMFHHMQWMLRCTLVPPFLPIRKGLPWRKIVLCLSCIDMWVWCTQFIRRKMFIFLCKLWRNGKVRLTLQLLMDFHQYHKKSASKPPLLSSSFGCTESYHLSLICASSALWIGVKHLANFLLSKI